MKTAAYITAVKAVPAMKALLEKAALGAGASSEGPGARLPGLNAGPSGAGGDAAGTSEGEGAADG